VSYYGAGDYYGAGGFFSSIGGALRGAVSGFVSSGFNPIGALTGGARGALGGQSPTGGVPVLRAPGLRAAGARLIPGGGTGLVIPGASGGRKRRRMQYTNMKALRRANRRTDGFVREVKKSLKHTNYKLVSKSAGKKRPTMIRESGPGGVVVN